MIAFRIALLAALLIPAGAVSAPVFPSDGTPSDGTVGLEPPPGMMLDGKGAFVRGDASIVARSMAVNARVAAMMRFAPLLAETETFGEVTAIISREHARYEKRDWLTLPL